MSLQPNPLHLILREPLLGAIVELGRARAFVRRHFLSVLQRTAIGKVSGDAGRAERVIADRRVNAGSRLAWQVCHKLKESGSGSVDS